RARAGDRRTRGRRGVRRRRQQPCWAEEYNVCVVTRSALLISTYEMGRQPFGLASAAAWLRSHGWTVRAIDTAKEKLSEASLHGADLVAFHLPMHTATRLAAPIISAARRANPSARIAAFGLYAPLNAEWLRSIGVDAVFGGEFEQELLAFADHLREPRSPQSTQSKSLSAISAPSAVKRLPRIHF